MTDDQERKPHRKRELTAMDPESLNFKALAVILALLGVLLGYLPAYWFWF